MMWKDFQRPKRLEYEVETLTNSYGKFFAQPFERGFGITIGNALRRVLLSAIEGAAITAVKIDKVLHEFSSLRGVLEDTTMIILNLKQIPFTKTTPLQQFRPSDDPRRFLVQESEEVKNLKIELRAAQDTLRELIKAFNDRSITPEVYFSRREKTKQRILSLEDEIKNAQRSNMGFSRLRDFMNFYSDTYQDSQPRR